MYDKLFLATNNNFLEYKSNKLIEVVKETVESNTLSISKYSIVYLFIPFTGVLFVPILSFFIQSQKHNCEKNKISFSILFLIFLTLTTLIYLTTFDIFVMINFIVDYTNTFSTSFNNFITHVNTIMDQCEIIIWNYTLPKLNSINFYYSFLSLAIPIITVMYIVIAFVCPLFRMRFVTSLFMLLIWIWVSAAFLTSFVFYDISNTYLEFIASPFSFLGNDCVVKHRLTDLNLCNLLSSNSTMNFMMPLMNMTTEDDFSQTLNYLPHLTEIQIKVFFNIFIRMHGYKIMYNLSLQNTEINSLDFTTFIEKSIIPNLVYFTSYNKELEHILEVITESLNSTTFATSNQISVLWIDSIKNSTISNLTGGELLPLLYKDKSSENHVFRHTLFDFKEFLCDFNIFGKLWYSNYTSSIVQYDPPYISTIPNSSFYHMLAVLGLFSVYCCILPFLYTSHKESIKNKKRIRV